MTNIAWGWTLFAGLAGWIVGIGMGIKYQKRIYDKGALLALKTVAKDIMAQAVAAGHAGTVRVLHEGNLVYETSDMPTDKTKPH